jgi:hypothetical protein
MKLITILIVLLSASFASAEEHVTAAVDAVAKLYDHLKLNSGEISGGSGGVTSVNRGPTYTFLTGVAELQFSWVGVKSSDYYTISTKVGLTEIKKRSGEVVCSVNEISMDTTGLRP